MGGIQFFYATILTIVKYLYEIDFRVQDSALEVVREQKIAAAADMQDRTGKIRKLDIHEVRHRVILHEAPCIHLHPEGVHPGQILIICSLYHKTQR